VKDGAVRQERWKKLWIGRGSWKASLRRAAGS